MWEIQIAKIFIKIILITFDDDVCEHDLYDETIIMFIKQDTTNNRVTLYIAIGVLILFLNNYYYNFGLNQWINHHNQ